jgi:hypothetical protein
MNSFANPRSSATAQSGSNTSDSIIIVTESRAAFTFSFIIANRHRQPNHRQQSEVLLDTKNKETYISIHNSRCLH